MHLDNQQLEVIVLLAQEIHLRSVAVLIISVLVHHNVVRLFHYRIMFRGQVLQYHICMIARLDPVLPESMVYMVLLINDVGGFVI